MESCVRKLVLFLALVLIQGAAFAQRAKEAGNWPPAKLDIIPTQTSAWQLVWADLEKDGKDEILYASYRGILTCQDVRTGRVKWTYDLEGLPYTIRTYDINGDGVQEVLAASASLYVYALSAKGKLLWRHGGKCPLYSVAAGRLLAPRQTAIAVGGEDVKVTLLTPSGKPIKQMDYLDPTWNRQRIRCLDAGDTDGDGMDELLVVDETNRFDLFNPRVGNAMWNLQGPNNSWGYLYDGKLLDLDGDGRYEAYVGTRNRVVAADGEGKVLWNKLVTQSNFASRQPSLAPVSLEGGKRLDLAFQYGPQVMVFDAQGNVRYDGNSGYFYFNGMAAAPSPKTSKQVMLASVTGADRNVYRITFGAGKEDEINAFADPPGYREEINKNLRAIRDQVLKLPADKKTPKKIYDLPISGGTPSAEQIAGGGKTHEKYRSVYPYDNIIYYGYLAYQETGYDTKQGATYPVPELMKLAETAEANGFQHVLIASHGTDPAFSPQTLDAWLQRTPKTCLGIAFSEINVSIYNIPEYAKYSDTLYNFMDNSMLPLIDVAAKHKKPTHLIMKQGWWVFTPAMKAMYTRLFTPERRKWLIPSVEESATTAPEINSMGWMGLWRSGLVESWECNVISDQIVVNSHFAEWMPSDPHHLLRHLVASAAAGATHFKISMPDHMRDGRRKYDFSDPPLNYTLLALLSQDTFLHLIGKGIIDVPTTETICGLSPVGFRFDEPAVAFLECDNHSVSNIPPEIPEVSEKGLFSGTEWAFTKTRDTYAPKYLLNIARYAHTFFPQAPFGFPTIVPSWYKSEQCAYMEKEWHTDGIDVYVNGARRSAKAMKNAILESFEKAAEKLPVRATHCFWMGTRRPDGAIRVTLVDVPYVDPEGAEVELITASPIKSLRDVIWNKPVPFEGNKAKIKIPAGAFRIVDVKPESVNQK